MARAFYLLLGLVCVGLGSVGAVLPVLPTTPFLLISLWAFAKSSHRLERWLLEHKRFGPRLVQWRAHRVIPLKVKLTAWSSMLGSLGVMLATGAPWQAIVPALALTGVGATYIATRPSQAPPDETRP